MNIEPSIPIERSLNAGFTDGALAQIGNESHDVFLTTVAGSLLGRLRAP